MALNTKFSLGSFLKQVNKLTESQKKSIKQAGFGNLLNIPNHTLRRSQLIQLLETWSTQKQAFILPPGELKITLLDVSLILGLRVIGQPINLEEDAALTTLETEFGASVMNRTINVDFLKEKLEIIGEKDDEGFVRVFLLYCFGILLFPSANGKLDSRYVNLLQDVEKISCFAWGKAVLEDLHRSLSQRKSRKNNNIGGCLILLQIWCYEHIEKGRPKLLNCPSLFPRVCRWESSCRNYSTSSEFNIEFEELTHNNIKWRLQPTKEEKQIDMIKEIPQDCYLRSEHGTIEQPIEIGSEKPITRVRVCSKEAESMRQEKSTILVLSDDDEQFEDENEELRKKVEEENEELRKPVRDEEELRKGVENENEELKKLVEKFEDENEELRKRVRDEEESKKKVENENEELKKLVEKLRGTCVAYERCITNLERILFEDNVDL